MRQPPKILVFDSGLGGLSVLAEIMRLRPDAACIYAADDAVFPYGGLTEAQVLARISLVMAALIGDHQPDLVVIACHTASTLVLPQLRAHYRHMSFVGTVPAIKPAALASRSGLISVLATPGTVARDYTQTLVRDFASQCAVTLVGATRLASLAEQHMQGISVDSAAILAEIAPAFVTSTAGLTDVIVLACTHYPLLLPKLVQLAPWPVAWIDPAPAIARRADHVLRQLLGAPEARIAPRAHVALFTSGRQPNAYLNSALRQRGLVARDWALQPCLPA